MTRTPIIAIATAVTIAVCIARMGPRSVAEPVLGGDRGTLSKALAPPQELTDAAALFKKDDYDGALQLVQEAVKKDADLPPAQVIMAQWFAKSNVPLKVRAALERAVAEAPEDPEAYILMGDIALSEGRHTEAELLYEKADRLMAGWQGSAKRKDALLPQIQSGLAGTCLARGDWTGARQHLEAWLKLDPKSSSALQLLARCLLQQKNVEGALEKLKEAAKIQPDMLTPEAVLGQWFARAGDQENAKKWTVAALNAAPKNAKTRLVAAQWAFDAGQLDEAKQQVEIALRLDPKRSDAKLYFQAKFLRGLVALFQKDYKTAEACFESAHRQLPKDFSASNNLALALVEEDEESKRAYALDLANTNAQQYPEMAEALATYGWVLYRRGQLDAAEKVLRGAATGGSLTPDTEYYWACVLKDRGQDAEAKQWLESALRSRAPFQHREEAKTLLEKLSGVRKK